MSTPQTKTFSYVFSILLCATFLSTPAFANEGDKSRWNIKKIVSKENSYPPYCTLTRQYKDAVLAIATNESGMSNIAIESSKDLLKVSGKSYISVTLETDLTNQTVSAKPLTKSAVLIELPKAGEINTLLKDTSTLNIASKDFKAKMVFKINGIDPAIQDLQLCLSELPEYADKITLKHKLAKKEEQLQDMQKILDLQQKQINNAPLYKQAKKSENFKNLNIARLDFELMQKQDDLERQKIDLSGQQEWLEKEQLRVKKLQKKRQEESRLISQKSDELKKEINKLSVIPETAYSDTTHITWDKEALSSPIVEHLKANEEQEFRVPDHSPVTGSNYYSAPKRKNAPISLKPADYSRTQPAPGIVHITAPAPRQVPAYPQDSSPTIIISSKDNLNDPRTPNTQHIQVPAQSKPIEVETTYVISAPEIAPAPKPIQLHAPINPIKRQVPVILRAPKPAKQQAPVSLRAPKPTKQQTTISLLAPEPIEVETTYIISMLESDPTLKPIQLHMPEKLIKQQTTANMGATKPKPVHLSNPKMLSQTNPVHLTAPIVSTMKEEIEPKIALTVTEPEPKITLNISKSEQKAKKTKTELEPASFTEPATAKKIDVPSLTKPIITSKPHEEEYDDTRIDVTEEITPEEDDSYGSFLDNIMDVHRGKRAPTPIPAPLPPLADKHTNAPAFTASSEGKMANYQGLVPQDFTGTISDDNTKEAQNKINLQQDITANARQEPTVQNIDVKLLKPSDQRTQVENFGTSIIIE